MYVNLFTGQATTQFPSVTETARGGVSLFQRVLMCFLCIVFPNDLLFHFPSCILPLNSYAMLCCQLDILTINNMEFASSQRILLL